jgi:NAD(P)-dependent dehydrogenase (short-subunit alcohol dehydrogenase family)
MLARWHGGITSLASVSGEGGARLASAPHAVSKAGVIMITWMFALHAADSGVTVNAVSPGTIVTAMIVRLGTRIDPRDVPMNRMGTIEEVAQAVVSLAFEHGVLHHRPDARRQRRAVHEIAEAP